VLVPTTIQCATLATTDRTGNIGGDDQEKMGDASDLRYNFNALINNTSFLTNKIKLLSQQTLQHGQKADFGVACDIMLLLWHQMLGTG